MNFFVKGLAVAATSAVLIGSASVAFAADSVLPNGDFESDPVGATSISDWTLLNSRIDLGVTSIAGCVTTDTSTYSTLGSAYAADDEDWYSYFANSYVGAPALPTPEANNDSAATDGLFSVTPFASTVTVLDGATLDASVAATGQVVELYSEMETAGEGGPANSIGFVIHGPAMYSEEFTATTAYDLSVDWAAYDGSDDHHVFGYLLNTATCDQTEVIDSNGGLSAWQTVKVAVPADGTYRFVFVSGTYDASWGGAAGAYLYVDNVTVGPRASALANTGLGNLTAFLVLGMVMIALGGLAIVRRRTA